MRSFCRAKASLIFSTKNISVFGYKVIKHLTSWSLDRLVKLTMLWTTGPRPSQLAKPLEFLFLDQSQEFIILSNGRMDLSVNLLIGNMSLVWNVQERSVASHLKGLHSFLLICCKSPWFNGKQKYWNDKTMHQLHLWSKKYVISPNWLQLCKSCSGLHNPWESLRVLSHHDLKQMKLVTVHSFRPFTLISLWMPLALSSVWSSQHRSPSYSLCRFCWDFQLGLLVPALPQLEHLCHWQIADGNITAGYAYISSRASDMICSIKMLKRMGVRRRIFSLLCCSEPFSHAAIHLDCSCILVVELLNGAN